MANPTPLPPEVVAALQRGNVVEAVKLLRKTVNLTLKEAKAAIDQRSHSLPGSERSPAPPRPSAPPSQAPQPSQVQLPIEALQALRLGKEIDAARITREKTGVGLKEAMDAVHAYKRQNPGARHGLSPGEVPPQRNEFWFAAAIVIVVVAAWLFIV